MSERIIISTNDGKIRGIKATSDYSGVEFYSFYGVRYGQPPTQNLRFKDPKAVKPWKDLYDATTQKPGCVQFSVKQYAFLGNEDCLFNNIHIPKLPVKGEPLKPVIVNIHPGAFAFGTPNEDHYGRTDFVMHHDVIYVIMAYRLHILGFLNLGLRDCSGNQGIKDILLSLKWIKRNIQAFGGDPDNITLLGSSSGGVIIHLLMLSPLAKDLFHKAILLGGYLYLPVLPLQETNDQHAYFLAKKLGFGGRPEDKKTLLTFLKKIQPEILIECQRQCAKDFQKGIAPIIPIGVFNITRDEEIIPESLQNKIHSISRIPIIVGFCERESIMGFAKGALKQQTEENFLNSIRQNCWGWGRNLNDNDIEYIDQRVKSFYTEGKPFDEVNLSTKVDIQTDIIMSDVYETLVDVISDDLPSSVFVYKFEFEGIIPTTKTMLKGVFDEDLPGSYHGCEFCYWNGFENPGSRATQQMVEYFTKFIKNFAKTGNPNSEDIPIDWKPTTRDAPCYLSINNPFAMVAGKLNNDRLEFWKNIKRHFMNK